MRWLTETLEARKLALNGLRDQENSTLNHQTTEVDRKYQENQFILFSYKILNLRVNLGFNFYVDP